MTISILSLQDIKVTPKCVSRLEVHVAHVVCRTIMPMLGDMTNKREVSDLDLDLDWGAVPCTDFLCEPFRHCDTPVAAGRASHRKSQHTVACIITVHYGFFESAIHGSKLLLILGIGEKAVGDLGRQAGKSIHDFSWWRP